MILTLKNGEKITLPTEITNGNNIEEANEKMVKLIMIILKKQLFHF